jgi:signal transduction histidine kinase/CheY-like chemotaxis protein
VGLGAVLVAALVLTTVVEPATWRILAGTLLSLLMVAGIAAALMQTLRLGRSAAESPLHTATWCSVAIRYVSAVGVVAAAALLRRCLVNHFGPLPLFITAYPAVLLVASMGGGGPGILATLLSALVADYWLIPPYGQFGGWATNDMFSLGIFTGSNLFLSVLAERLRKAREAETLAALRTRQMEELARLNEELTQQSEELAQQNEELQSQSEEIQLLNTELGQREHMLQKLLDSARHSRAEQTVLQEICEVGLEVFTPLAAVVAVWESHAARLSVRALAGHGVNLADLEPRSLTGSFGEFVLHENRTACLNDTSLRPDFRLLRLRGEEPFKSVLASPLTGDGPPTSVVAVYSRQTHEWTSVEFRLAEWLAAQSAGILEMLRLQKAVEQTAEQLRLALDAARMGAWDYRFDTGEIFWDSWCRTIAGVPAGGKISYTDALSRIHAEDRAAVDSAIQAALAGADDGNYHCEYRMVWPDGSEHWVDGHGRVCFEGQDGARHPVRFIGVNTDITERKRIEEELRLAKQAADAANEAKSQFLANMSHEIRTPMTAVLGFTDLLVQADSSPEEQREYLDIVQRNGKGLLQLIDDILDLSKIEAGKVTLESVACSPYQVVEDVLSLMRVHAEEKRLRLEACYHHAVPLTIHTDLARLRQILVNLVGNAIKFTEQGGVRILVTANEDPAGSRLRFAVSDTGIGISPEHLAEIFRPFNQADASLTRRFGGTGLGLTISRRLAWMLGGEITVQSEPGQGSTFTLSIRTAVHAEPTPPKAHPIRRDAVHAASPLRGRVLVVEDTPASQFLMRKILTKAGLDVVSAADGDEGCRLAERSAAEGQPFDVILLDMQMPGVDGYEAARRLRQRAWRRPIIAITAHAMAGDRERCLAAGCNDYLAKPISREHLVETLSRYLGA